MSIIDLFELKRHRNNVAHFATIIHIATIIDGLMNEFEELVIDFFHSFRY